MGPARDQPSRLAPGRTRASVACTGCRHKRKKCVTDMGEKSCNHCKDSGLECVFRNDDERRRPRSRVFMDSLLEHIELLKSRLKEVDGELPSQFQGSDSQSHTHHGATQEPSGSWLDQHNAADVALSRLVSNESALQEESVPSGQSDNDPQNESPLSNATSTDDGFNLLTGLRNQAPSLEVEQAVRFFLSQPNQLKYDASTGALRYFTPVASYQHCADLLTDSQRIPSGSWHLQRRLQHVIKDLDPVTHEHLMSCFWSHYNNVLQVVDQVAFQQDQDEDKLHYSGFLHICCLAMGFRFADKSRHDIKALDRGNKHSTFHESVRYMVETELENPRGLTTIQGLLVLSDLECAVGRDRSGWMYAGVACRFAFEMGLTIDHSKSNLPRREIEIRQRLLRACVVYDRIWAICSGHPTVIKRSDLSFTEFSPTYSTVRSFVDEPSSWPGGNSTETEAWDALLSLLELATRVSGHVMNATLTAEFDEGTTKYMTAAILHSALESWHRKLPPQLRLNPEDTQSASGVLFFTHQLYHSTFILLHCSLMQNKTSQPSQTQDTSQTETISPFQAVSQTICLENALSIVRVMDAYFNKAGLRGVSVFTPQPASVALNTLIENVTTFGSASRTATILQHIQILTKVLEKLSPNYRTAEDMCRVVNNVLPQIRTGAVNAIDFDLRDPASHGMSSRSPMQSTSQTSLDATTHLEQWAPFPGSEMNTDGETIVVDHHDFSRSMPNWPSTQGNADIAMGPTSAAARSVGVDSTGHHTGNMLMGKDDFLDLGNSCQISPFSISGCNWDGNISQQLDRTGKESELSVLQSSAIFGDQS